MNQNKDNHNLKKKNLIVGWAIGILAVILYIFVIYTK